jgi:hypothetical protein
MDSLPAPATAGSHGHRNSISFPQPQFQSSGPHSAGGLPPPQSRPPPTNTNMAYHYQQRNDELQPPPSASSSFGSLARSASLGARKKDPYAYASDDVESGLGNMDMADEQGGWGYNRPDTQGQGRNGMYNSPMRDVGMSSPAGARPLPGSTMNPPPIPSHLSRPPQLKTRTDSASPSKLSPVGFGAVGSGQRPNPYAPRGSDGGSSGNNQWADYRPPTNQRVASGGSARSLISDPLSPYSRNDLSPHSPMTNPYDGASPVGFAPYDQGLLPMHGNTMPVSPMQHSPQWGGYSPVSPAKAPPNVRSQSQQLFPTSQSANPALQGQQDSSMRGSSRTSSNRGSSRQGLRDVRNVGDLKPVVNTHSNGRRADPTKSGKYLSVSYPGFVEREQQLT